jgi:hypothetical protein
MGEKIAAGPAGRSEMTSKGNNRNFRGGTREVRQLPFEEDIFRDICKKFYVHASISRVISRADVPLFSRFVVKMGGDDSDGPGHSAIGIREPNFLSLLWKITTFTDIHKSLQL